MVNTRTPLCWSCLVSASGLEGRLSALKSYHGRAVFHELSSIFADSRFLQQNKATTLRWYTKSLIMEVSRKTSRRKLSTSFIYLLIQQSGYRDNNKPTHLTSTNSVLCNVLSSSSHSFHRRTWRLSFDHEPQPNTDPGDQQPRPNAEDNENSSHQFEVDDEGS